jgi:hypothetical protein
MSDDALPECDALPEWAQYRLELATALAQLVVDTVYPDEPDYIETARKKAEEFLYAMEELRDY